MKRKKKWRKILYEDQGYQDNYVHSSFMSSLLTNCKQNLKRRFKRVTSMCPVVEGNKDVLIGIKYKYSHVCHSMLCVNHQIIVVLFLLLAYHCIDKNITSNRLIYAVNITIIILKEVLIYQVHKSINLLLLIHLMFHNYGFIYEKNENIDIFDSTSLSCAVIASVILGSRLASIVQLKNISYYNYGLFPLMFLILSLCIRSISAILFYLNFLG
ncbi:phosphatidylinositol N-acetylglucosaminyltransferase domain-containing protein [Plasmodium vivax India VII]|uniref:Phosphatidylinositol N-acetylglucosaminyltransferase domain containing protein n=5 Tax=Plasmodium vivax TaxID=5855 RepID=A5K6H9_PLAVS|nr:phosphatidylinositol N-acetylglucosaminyltransferase domain containing protein [Plasmodium vivax]KMZ81375.1 phosphatidylinositol N-acetylglucosaminyltransferase domain-containing protein [Plasmodium vivax India VII]KMZ87323.1 phosphatidylinositol N-acetylglucosaminyltransferase domain-containing protein [Plasmodium vivax Brazil I]KMZ93918.1 phosphatidylinositol N-acetylglucosaminyltransferase domain-containing protein [Plasmodium vivax Mauritania I]KNA00313.1 phosphatidylinositol N-acetylglu|eukprot:XP_001614647.1 phosphatidylinositol N-acetylglucosaminyltransferase domain containing protein [Plasmodium vivax Sal-1]